MLVLFLTLIINLTQFYAADQSDLEPAELSQQLTRALTQDVHLKLHILTRHKSYRVVQEQGDAKECS